MTERLLRAAILGCGRFAVAVAGLPYGLGARSHLEAYESCPATLLVAGYDPDIAARGRFTARSGCPAYADLEQLLRESRPDIVTIASPDATHVDLLERVVAWGVRAVLIEKPLAVTLEQAARARHVAAAGGTVVAMNFSRRYAPVLRQIAGRINAGALGRLQLLRGTYTNGLRRNGSHLLDLVRWWGGEITAVRASCRVAPALDDPTLDLDCELTRGCRALLHGLDGAAFDHLELDVIGTLGRVRMVRFGHTVEIYEIASSDRHPGYREEKLAEQHDNVLFDVTRHAVDALVDSTLHGSAPVCSLAEGTVAVAVVEAAMRSYERGVYEQVLIE